MSLPHRRLGRGRFAPLPEDTHYELNAAGSGDLACSIGNRDARCIKRQRVESVTPQSPRQWGTMEVDQMLHHLNLACGGSLGLYSLPDESYLSTRTLGKWILVDWFQRVGQALADPLGLSPEAVRSVIRRPEHRALIACSLIETYSDYS
jgi:hypothetical protein